MKEVVSKLLVIEDNPGDVALIREALLPKGGYEIAHVTTVADSLLEIAKAKVDVVLLDLSLPDSLGVETVSAIHKHTPNVPIVVLTGFDDAESVALSCIKAGAEDFIPKNSLSEITLRRALAHALSRHHQDRIAALERTLEQYENLSSKGGNTGVTRNLSGSLSVKEAAPEEFASLSDRYQDILRDYLVQLSVRTPKPSGAMASLISELGELDAGPRDLVDLHLASVAEAVRGVSANRASALSLDGRLFALELMGMLVEYYRLRTRRDAVPLPKSKHENQTQTVYHR